MSRNGCLNLMLPRPLSLFESYRIDGPSHRSVVDFFVYTPAAAEILVPATEVEMGGSVTSHHSHLSVCSPILPTRALAFAEVLPKHLGILIAP